MDYIAGMLFFTLLLVDKRMLTIIGILVRIQFQKFGIASNMDFGLQIQLLSFQYLKNI